MPVKKWTDWFFVLDLDKKMSLKRWTIPQDGEAVEEETKSATEELEKLKQQLKELYES